MKKALLFFVLAGTIFLQDYLWPPPPPSKAHFYRFRGKTMGTTYNVKFTGAFDRQQQVERIKERVESILLDIDLKMSTYRKDSEVSRFNSFRKSGLPFGVSRETALVVQKALDIGRASGGAFDVTVAPLVNLWGFGPEKTKRLHRLQRFPPLQKDIDRILRRVGQQHLSVDLRKNALIKKNPGLAIDLSAIAKGYAVDRLAQYLQSQDILHYLVEVGGELRALGHKEGPGQRPWVVAIESPFPSTSPRKALSLNNQAMATSGNYRNYYETQDGKSYSHTLNPKTGWPVTHNLASVSVIADECMEADAWATAFMVLGARRALPLAIKLRLKGLFYRTKRKWRERGF